MKSAERNLLDEATLRHNQESIKKQLSKFLDFGSDAPNAAKLVNNYDWMKEYTFLNFIRDIGKHLTVNYMMAKDSVKKRLSSESSVGMSFTEFSYQLLQGYDFLFLYQSIPDRDKSCLPLRKTFYGQVPRTAAEMYEHTKNVNDYYFGEIGVETDHEGTIAECRQRGFALLEGQSDFLKDRVFLGSYDEEWSLRKVLRRFIWHDRIHAKAMYRMAVRTFGGDIPDPFHFT